ncbi:site-2 protease family protein [Candidatus Bathyarchaeota archaeon]|nr:site-2 protease family protein [Candidatus Bathyarchaeota archaeon]
MSDEEKPTPEESRTETVFSDSQGQPSIADSYLLRLRDIVKEEFVVNYAYIDASDNLPIFVVEVDSKMKERSHRLTKRLQPHNLLAVIRTVELFEGTGEKSTVIKLIPAPPSRKASSYTMNIILFVATVITVLFAGWFFATNPAFVYIYVNIFGIPYNPYLVMVAYTIALLAIIGLHEFGHVGASRYHNVEASLPYFIPGFYYGTFGALIVQRSPPPTRDSLFDLGISGPVVGFVISVVVVVVGLLMSPILSPAEFAQLSAFLSSIGLTSSPLPTPLLFDLIWGVITFGIPSGYTAYIHPVAFAGWVGFLITALNYFPIGQLDGGHVSRALVGPRYHRLVSFVGIFLLFIFGYWFMAMIAFFLFAGQHPGPVDDVSPVSKWRMILGPLSYVMVVLLLPPLTIGFLLPFP